MYSDVCVIIRSVGERTEAKCRYLLEKQVNKENIITVREIPFSASMRKSYSLGVGSNKKWTLCIDSDVLVKDSSINKLIQYADSLPENVFEVQGLILDKFIPIKRCAGNHLFRTKLLPKAITLIPPEGSTLRPEGTTIKKMVELGYPYAVSDTLIGLHDFEQFYSDIYRKCYTHAHKHKYMFSEIEQFWKNHSEDLDYQVASLGAIAGKVNKGTVLIDKKYLLEESLFALEIKGITEKNEISPKSFETDLVDQIYQQFPIHPELQKNLFPPNQWNQIIEKKKRSVLRKNVSTALDHFGSQLERVGGLFKGWAKRI